MTRGKAAGTPPIEHSEPPAPYSRPQTVPKVDCADPDAPRHAVSATTPADSVTLLPVGTRIFNAFRELANSGDAKSDAFRKHLVTKSKRFALWAQNLAAKIRNSRNRPQRATWELYKHIPPQLRELYIREREEAEVMIVSYIQQQSLSKATQRFENDKDPSVPKYEPSGPKDGPAGPLTADIIEQYASPSNFLVKRIGIANARRRQQFVYWREHAARIRGGATAHNVKQPSNPKGKGPLLEQNPAVPQSRLEPRAASSAPRQSLATSTTKVDEKELVRTDGLQSVISRYNRVSTIVTSQGPKLEWPPPPAHMTARPAEFITCPYCHLIYPGQYLAKDAWRSHIIQDLQPYHCTYEGCSDPNRLYGSYQEWIDHESQHTRVWHCHRHAREFETQLEYTQHLRQDHSDTAPKRFSPELVSAAIGPSLRVHRDCPLCPTVFTEVSEMQRHLRYHLERLALFSLPSQNVDWDDGATGKSSDSHQIIQGRGRQASLERDFDDDSNLSSSLSIDSGPGIEENKQVLLETLRQYAPPKPDELAATAMRRLRTFIAPKTNTAACYYGQQEKATMQWSSYFSIEGLI
ncbi:PR domain zinc finger protein 16 [Madurella mycetomatis]|uniref:PR domain zinc finger protein 16 n=1 Tax=Madurella mycetomatis TaxID=100816 RepID=A0A175VPU2_9PEZI|nr:PR domain zinc finger protein 16 [Madurella mycetomatis]